MKTLSKKIEEHTCTILRQEFLRVEDVKQFIKDLKQSLQKSIDYKVKGDDYNNTWNTAMQCCIDEIDKLAGEELI